MFDQVKTVGSFCLGNWLASSSTYFLASPMNLGRYSELINSYLQAPDNMTEYFSPNPDRPNQLNQVCNYVLT